MTNFDQTTKKDPKITDQWKEYSAALVRWKLSFDLWQQAGNDAFVKYNQALQTLGTNTDLPQSLAKEW